MKYLYYCNSAYQLLNILNLHHQRKDLGFENIENYEADLIILNAFQAAKKISEIIKQQNIFSKVILLEKAEDVSGRLHTIKSFCNIAFPSYYLKSKFNLDKKDLKYDVLTVPKFSKVLGAIFQLNKNARLQLFDEGIATYWFAYDLIVPRSKSYKMLYKPFNYGRDFLDFDVVYVTYPEFFTGDCPEKVKRFPVFDLEYIEEIKELFSEFKGDEKEYDKKMLWFSQSMFDDEEVLKVLREYRDDILFCPHPRYPTSDDAFDISDPNQIWEIKSMNLPDINNKCLISIHSTALISPKLLFDYEPYVIFTFKMINFDYYWDFDGTVTPFAKLYSDPKKVMFPETLEELKECIEFVLKQIK